jgi:GNAT superfamily N-acetyltransferase
MQEILLRQAVPADLSRLAQLLEKLFAIEEDFRYSFDLQRQGLSLLLDSEYGTIIVATQGNTIVGMITGQLTISTAEGGRSLLVEDLYVDEQAQGRGVGKRLLHEVGKWASKKDANRMQLLADVNNLKALDFYTHLGWQRTQLICLRNYFSDGKA